jgi:hypothetical protein
MSYRNPQQVIDTQSGQHIRNMMKTVTDTAVNVIKTNQAALRKREKENVENQQQLLIEQGRYANAVDAADIKNAGTDWQTGLELAKKRHAELVKKRNEDPLNFSQMDAKELSFYQTLPATIKAQSIETEAKMQTYNGAMAKVVGEYGALDKFADPKEYEQMNTEGRVGLTGGKSIGSVTFDRELGIGNAKVTSYRLDGTEIGTDANRNFDPPIVPDPTKDFEKISQILNKTNIKENQYKKNENGTPAIVLKRVKVEGGDDYSVEVQQVDMEDLIRKVRSHTDIYVESLSVQRAIRLRNNKAADLVPETKILMGGFGRIGLGEAGNIVDPDKSTWDRNAQGEIIDPESERTKIAIAKLYIKENGLGQEKVVRRINDKKRAKIQNKESSFKSAIDNFAPEIDAGSKGVWELKGEGDDRYYFLPAPVDKDGIQKAGTKDRKIPYYIYPDGEKKINEIGLRAGMLKVKDSK